MLFSRSDNVSTLLLNPVKPFILFVIECGYTAFYLGLCLNYIHHLLLLLNEERGLKKAVEQKNELILKYLLVLVLNQMYVFSTLHAILSVILNVLQCKHKYMA